MSNIYIQEPPTNGKVILKTTIGEIEIELWSKETPKACRNFIQLCMEGYYDNTIFHRVIKDFIAQGGDPTGTGQGGESIYGSPFKDEIHSRLRFNRRGLVAMANADKDDNGSQFFFTLGACPELQAKHTIFGKVAGQTIYNMIKLNECEVIDERPIRPERIISTQVVYNPFTDIVPRNQRAEPNKKQDYDKEKSKQKKGVKNFGLLSFGEEAEEEEDELENVTKELKFKKSAHDIGDPSLLSKKVIEQNDLKKKKKRRDSSTSSSNSSSESETETRNFKKNLTNDSDKKENKIVDLESIKSKLKKKDDSSSLKKEQEKEASKMDQKELKKKQTQEEIKKLERELLMSKKKEVEQNLKNEEKEKEKTKETEVFQKYKQDVEKYEHLKNKKSKSSKEDKTLELLNSFRERLFKAKHMDKEETDINEEKEKNEEEESGEKSSLDSILTHRLDLDEDVKKKVIDANIADHDRYDIYDPRNPLNKRKREESREIIKEKKKGYASSFK